MSKYEEWIEADHTSKPTSEERDDTDPEGISNLFLDDDPLDTFEYRYKTFEVPQREVTLSVVGHKQENGQTLSSTGLTLWRSRAAEYMNEYLLKRPWPSTSSSYNALELGSGIGLNGLLLSFLNVNGSTTLTDGDTETLKNLEENVQRNKGGCEVRQLRWGVDEVKKEWDLIIASDVIYVPNVVPLLFDVVTTGLREGGEFVLAYARRNVKFELVLEEAERRGMAWEEQESGVEGENVWVFSMKSEVEVEVKADDNG
ncbi:hypothetical protein TrVE_jg10388 [Triparma verrucosa]|uniref:Uncharacterized protein n=1 Tax=Triparma verrucosa TaxID=1606542 RepID=A0A9W7KUT8_9STRA|nr:hypothetical protein TrVE_jg10388 [Triparma verrucosa]